MSRTSPTRRADLTPGPPRSGPGAGSESGSPVRLLASRVARVSPSPDRRRPDLGAAFARRSPRSRRPSARRRTGRSPTPGSPARSSSSTRSTRNASCGDVVAEEAVDAVADDLVEAADRRATTGVAAGERLDRDEPERLRPRPGHQHGVALGEERVAVGLPDSSPRNSTTAGRLQGGLEDLVVVVLLLAVGPTFAAIFSGRPAAWAISIASTIPFSGVTRPTKQSASVRRRSKGAIVERQAVVDDRPRHVRVGGRLVLADRDETGRRIVEELVGPGQVEAAVECRDDRHRAMRGAGAGRSTRGGYGRGRTRPMRSRSRWKVSCMYGSESPV